MNEPKSRPIFCQRCGHSMETVPVAGRLRSVCPECGYVLYQNPVPGVGVLVEMDDGVVMIRRGHSPHQGKWALPAGYVEADESLEEAAVRECKEETNLDIELVELFGVDSFPEGPIQSGIIIFYRARPVGGELRAGDDASQARVFPPNALPPDTAFRTHREVLARWAGLHGATPPFAAPPAEISLAPDLLIRQARLDDEQQVLSLLKLIPHRNELDETRLDAARLRFRESTGMDVLVAEYGRGEVVGFLALSYVPALTGLRAWISGLAVNPTHRRQGIGRALVEAAVQRASRRGATHLFLDTSRGSSQASEFYRACGFREEGVAPLRIR